ncbi:anti-sigma factor domain-containing protein [Caldalkalibacillus thermarum TA2.A1]|uniref:Anti-sigma factor domain-containing protein n=1 Tax=Caldalkalibacillus thermarum (strain TA2.A1) TaxID=986075 RepID=A0A8X8IA05_CALTT|nr:anti-sigma factor domain-containing protein [Caldalkalibacillus thermarum]QZT33764.1 anti-sigma factor domain-containing protein [Caldalkalibacillus thermarum TA2.A1]
MSKGIVLEVKENEAIVLAKDGSFHAVRKCKDDQLQIGDEIDLPVYQQVGVQKKRFFHIPIIALVASCFLLVAMLMAYIVLGPDHTAVAYVHLDLNPSMEMSVNKSMEVLSLKGLNADGQRLVEYMDDWSHRSLQNVIVNMLITAQDQGYLQDVTDVLVTTSAVGDRDIRDYDPYIVMALQEAEAQLIQSENFFLGFRAMTSGEQDEPVEISANHKSSTQSSQPDHYIIFHQVNTDQTILHEAKQAGVSPGKYLIYLHALEQGLNLDLEEIKERSVSELARELGGLDPVLSRPLSPFDPNEAINRHTDQPSSHDNSPNKRQNHSVQPETLPTNTNNAEQHAAEQHAPDSQEETEEEDTLSFQGQGPVVSAHVSNKKNKQPAHVQENKDSRPVKSPAKLHRSEKPDDRLIERKPLNQNNDRYTPDRNNINSESQDNKLERPGQLKEKLKPQGPPVKESRSDTGGSFIFTQL